jgi:8-oxo-dGTP pyrophosphatase MutT (NUDIX family)
MTARRTTCGVIVTDGVRIILGHAARSPRWDIPKGIAEPGETFAQSAARELNEETGLDVSPAELADLGVHAYLAGKDIALFALWRDPLPDPSRLVCRSTFIVRGGGLLPELDRFAAFDWDDALSRVGKNLARVLAAVQNRVPSTPPVSPPA